jgi:hypothetical protein
MNQGLTLIAAWWIADQPGNFLHAVLKSKYFAGTSIWHSNLNTPKSAFQATVVLKSTSQGPFFKPNLFGPALRLEHAVVRWLGSNL